MELEYRVRAFPWEWFFPSLGPRLFSGLPPLCHTNLLTVSLWQSTPVLFLRSDPWNPSLCTHSPLSKATVSVWALLCWINWIVPFSIISVMNFLCFAFRAPTVLLLSEVLLPSQDSPLWEGFWVCGNFSSFRTPFLGSRSPFPNTLSCFFCVYLLPYLILRRLVYLCGSLGSSASIQYMFYGVVLNADEFLMYFLGRRWFSHLIPLPSWKSSMENNSFWKCLIIKNLNFGGKGFKCFLFSILFFFLVSDFIFEFCKSYYHICNKEHL